MSFTMPHLVDVYSATKREGKVMPGIINLEATTTLTGEQRQMIDGIVEETRRGKMTAPGLPGMKTDVVPVVAVKKSATTSAIGMRKIRGTKY